MTLEEFQTAIHATAPNLVFLSKQYSTMSITKEDCTLQPDSAVVCYNDVPLQVISSCGTVYSHLDLISKLKTVEDVDVLARALLAPHIKELEKLEHEYVEMHNGFGVAVMHNPKVYSDIKEDKIHISMYEKIGIQK